MKKATNTWVSTTYLSKRVHPDYPKAKWIEFCEEMLARGYKIQLYEARETFSKYVTVVQGDKRFRVRFSNHRPHRTRELGGDCDFFVGVTHTGTRNTNDAIRATTAFFGESPEINLVVDGVKCEQ